MTCTILPQPCCRPGLCPIVGYYHRRYGFIESVESLEDVEGKAQACKWGKA